MTKRKRQRAQEEGGKSSKRGKVKPPSKKRDNEPDGDPPPPRSRPDRGRKKAESSLYDSFVIKSSLSGLILPSLGVEVKTVFLEILEEHIKTISQMAVRGSLLANEVMLERFRRGEEVAYDSTFFRRCMCGDGGQNDPTFDWVLQECFGDHPHINRNVGDWPIINYAANRLQTCFTNDVWMRFESRLKSYVRDWLEIFGDIASASVVVALILGTPFATTTALGRLEWQFIAGERRRLGLDGNPYPQERFIPEAAPIGHMLGSLYNMMDFRKTFGIFGGGFSLVPLNKIKRHYVTIDTSGLYLMLSQVFRRLGERTPLWIQEAVTQEQGQAIVEYRDVMWRMFDVSRLSKHEFTHTIDTDGVATSLHFRRPKSATPNLSISPADLREKHRIISIDPGRVNIITAHEIDTTGKDKFYTFSRRSYYGAIKSSLGRLKSWETALQDINAEMSLYSIRTAHADLCAGYRRVYFNQYNRLWAVRFDKRWARERFHIYIAKRSCLDRFFASFLKEDRRPPTILYGAASLRPGGVGEMSVPVKKVLKTCRRFFLTVLVSEYLTTKCHSACGSRMHPVRNRQGVLPIPPRRRGIRGLYYCAKCKRFVNRDRDACKSIRHTGLADERPRYLSFTRPYEARGTLDVLPPKIF
jgi:hypothetical protein